MLEGGAPCCSFYWKNAVCAIVGAALSAALIWFVVYMLSNFPSMGGAMYPLIVLAPISGGFSLYMLACSWWSCSGQDPLSNEHETTVVTPPTIVVTQSYQGVSYTVN